MDDKQILDLYWSREEEALTETRTKYGRYCHSIAYNILHSDEDAEECVNDTCVRAWDSIPPQRPERLSAFLGRITRNIALDRYKSDATQKRSGDKVNCVLEELEDCIPDTGTAVADDLILKDMLERFLRSLPEQTMKVFMRRYWYMSSVSEIATEFGIGESKVKVLLFRTRNKLKEFLEEEGIEL